MRTFWSNNEPIPWVKIHDVPDFVRFPHKEHINADSNRLVDDAGAGCDSENAPRSLECKLAQFQLEVMIAAWPAMVTYDKWT